MPDLFPLKSLSPPMSLMACIGAEVGASILIILGSATRPRPSCWVSPWWWRSSESMEPRRGSSRRRPSSMAKELGLLYLIPMIAIILAGAGAFSLDAGIYGKANAAAGESWKRTVSSCRVT